MPAFNFKKQFAADVESRKKRQTIRAKRKDGRNPHVGDELYLYTGMRTKSCRKLGEEICKFVHQITIDEHGHININGEWLPGYEELVFIYDDGFKNAADFTPFFRKEHGLPFEGLLYKW
jgi:hypothetical protein